MLACRRTAFCLLTGAWLALRMAVPAAQQDESRFEIVSLRRVPPLCGFIELSLRCEQVREPDPTWHLFPGGRVEVTNHLAIDLIRVAYRLERVDPEYLSGGPDWLRKERYDLTALTGADGFPGLMPAVLDEIRPLLRTLLDTRFKLRIRESARAAKIDVGVLRRTRAGTLGPQMLPTKGHCAAMPADARSVAVDQPGCAFENGTTLVAGNITTADLARLLSRQAQLPVVDETGSTARYDITLTLSRPAVLGGDLSAARLTVLQRDLRDQLGLDLRRDTRTMSPPNTPNRLIIDSAERPVDD